MGLFINNPYIKEYQRQVMDGIDRMAAAKLPYQLKMPEGVAGTLTPEAAAQSRAVYEAQQAAELKEQAVRQVDFEEACEEERARRRGRSPQDLMNELKRARDHETWLSANKNATDQYLESIGVADEAREKIAQSRREGLRSSNQEHLEDIYGFEAVSMQNLYKKYAEIIHEEAAGNRAGEDVRQRR